MCIFTRSSGMTFFSYFWRSFPYAPLPFTSLRPPLHLAYSSAAGFVPFYFWRCDEARYSAPPHGRLTCNRFISCLLFHSSHSSFCVAILSSSLLIAYFLYRASPLSRPRPSRAFMFSSTSLFITAIATAYPTQKSHPSNNTPKMADRISKG